MGNIRRKGYIVIELFNEKTGEVIRKIRFQKPFEFDKFLKDFKAMRYPGYRWRYKDKKKKKENNE